LKQREVLHLRPKSEYGNTSDPNPVVLAFRKLKPFSKRWQNSLLKEEQKKLCKLV